jgi:hypothetical protein
VHSVGVDIEAEDAAPGAVGPRDARLGAAREIGGVGAEASARKQSADGQSSALDVFAPRVQSTTRGV